MHLKKSQNQEQMLGQIARVISVQTVNGISVKNPVEISRKNM